MAHSLEPLRMTGRVPTASWALFARQLGDNISTARERLNLSQEHVAIAAGLSRHTYQRLEKGLKEKGKPTNPTLYTLLAVCAVLGVSLTDVLPPTHPGLFSAHPAGNVPNSLFPPQGPLEPRPGHDIYGMRFQ